MESVSIKRPNSRVLPVSKSVEDEIQEDKNKQLLRAEKRIDIFRSILDNTCADFGSPKYIFTTFLTTLGCIMGTCLYMIIPMHNLIQTPKYWYEFPIPYTITFVPLYSAHIMYDFSFCMNIDVIETFGTFSIMTITLATVSWTLLGSFYLLWTYGLRLQYPVPLIGYINFSIQMVTILITIWFRFPKAWRKNGVFSKRLMWCVLAIFCFNLQPLENILWTQILLKIPKETQ